MSFKYRFIVSFVLLEVFFIILIVSINFIAINNSSNKLIKEQIESNLTFLNEMLKVPLSIYDLATIDNLLYKTKQLHHVNSIAVLDTNGKLLSENYSFKHFTLDELIKYQKSFNHEFADENYEIRYKKIEEDDTFLGSLYVVFDTSENRLFIKQNMRNTIAIIIVEILLSTLLSYLIGSRLTRMLTNLSTVAEEIGETKIADIPYKNSKDEIGILANSLNKMQHDLKARRESLNSLTKDLQEQKEELLIANKSKDIFLANMSHELKTPLNSINIISSVMSKNKNKNLSEKDVYNLKVINKCGHDLLYLINDVLDISKLEARELTLNKENVDLKFLIRDIYETFNPQIINKKLQLFVEYDESITFIYSDKTRIKQIVENLLSNALKFTSKGKITLLVKDRNKFVELIVKDEGIGIKKEKLDDIFDRFKQADESTTRKYGGTGLGLSICKELSTLLGGDIKVESTFNKGTTFRVFIAKNEEELDDKKSLVDKKTQSKTILFLNKNPIHLFKTIIELNKAIEIEQVSTIKDYKNRILNKEYALYILDVDKNDLNEIKKLNNRNVVLLIRKELIDTEILNKFIIIDKSLDSTEICKLIKDRL